jgi:hypothetical protein
VKLLFLIGIFTFSTIGLADYCGSSNSIYGGTCSTWDNPSSCGAHSGDPTDCVWVASSGSGCSSSNPNYVSTCSIWNDTSSCEAHAGDPTDCVWVDGN